MNSETYIAFIQLLAEHHPDILHDDATNDRFSKFGEEVVTSITGTNTLKIKDFCVLIYANEFDCPTTDDKSRTFKDYSFNFEICKYCQPKDFEAQLSAQQQAERIAQDFINEMKHYRFENRPPFHRGTDFVGRIQGNPTAGGKANLYGHRCEIPLRVPVAGAESHTPFSYIPE